jgi:hypothetical protein
MRLVTAGILASAVVAVSGCGSGMNGVSQADVQAYAALAQGVASSASAYGTAANATVDPTGCASTHASYDGQVRPMVDRMRSMSGKMDDEMGRMGRGADGDMSCGADAMETELAHHDAVACTSTVMPANHAEASRHATAMTTWAAHQLARADEVGGMMGMGGGGMMGPGGGMMDPGSATTTMACHRNGDGTFTLGP